MHLHVISKSENKSNAPQVESARKRIKRTSSKIQFITQFLYAELRQQPIYQ